MADGIGLALSLSLTAQYSPYFYICYISSAAAESHACNMASLFHPQHHLN